MIPPLQRGHLGDASSTSPGHGEARKVVGYNAGAKFFDSSFHFEAEMAVIDSCQFAISRFAALPLSEKVAAIGKAAINLEHDLESKGRSLGHPGDWPSDYKEAIGHKLLGEHPGYRNDDEAVFSAAYLAADLLSRAGLSVSTDEAKTITGIDALVLASSTPENEFIGFIHDSI